MIISKLWHSLAAQVNKLANFFWTADPIAQMQYEYDRAVAQLKEGLGPRGKTICAPSISASRLTPSWVGGKVKLSVWPKITGYSSRTSELMAVW